MMDQISPASFIDRIYNSLETENPSLLYAAFFAASAALVVAAGQYIRSKYRAIPVEVSEATQRTHNFATWIICEMINDGSGDIMQALSVYQLLKNKFPEEKIHFCTSNVAASRKLDELIRAKNPLVPLDEDRVANMPDQTDYDENLVIQLPVFQDGQRTFFKASPKAKVEKWFISEYVFTPPSDLSKSGWKTFSSGCDKNQLGVFLANEEYYQRALQRGAQQDNVALKALFETREINLPSMDPTASIAYFGYIFSWNTTRTFLAQLAAYNKKNETDLTVILPGTRLAQGEGFERMMGGLKFSGYLKYLEDLKVGKLEIYQRENGAQGSDYKIHTLNVSEKNTKTLRLVLPGFIPESMTLDFHLAAQPITITTGDKSFSNALSMGIPTIYEVRGHKQRSFDGFCEVLGDEVSAHLKATVVDEYEASKFREYTEEFVDTMAKQSDEERLGQFREAAKILREKHSYQDNLTQLFKRKLYQVQNPIRAIFSF